MKKLTQAEKATRAKKRDVRATRRADADRKATMLRASNPLAFSARYETGRTVFGEAVPVDFLVGRISSFDWREAFIRLGHLASVLANDDDGPYSERAVRLTAAGINALTASSQRDRALLQRGRSFVANAGRALIVAHEEAIVFLEHLVLLHGGEGGLGP